MGDRMLSVAQKRFIKGFCTISAANDAPANDVMYRITCGGNAKREADETFSQKDYINAFSNVKKMHSVEKEMPDPCRKVLDMNIINKIYRRIFSSKVKNEALVNNNYKKHLKELISKNVCGISFVKGKSPSKPDQLVSDTTTSEILDPSIKKCMADNIDQL